MTKEKQIEEKACKNCIHYQMCVDTFRKGKQDGDYLLIEEDAYFAKADGCDFYADKRVYRKQIEGEWIICSDGYYPYCSNCNHEPKNGVMTNYCPKCGAKMKGGAE